MLLKKEKEDFGMILKNISWNCKKLKKKEMKKKKKKPVKIFTTLCKKYLVKAKLINK